MKAAKSSYFPYVLRMICVFGFNSLVPVYANGQKTRLKNQKKSLYKLCTFHYNSTCGSGL